MGFPVHPAVAVGGGLLVLISLAVARSYQVGRLVRTQNIEAYGESRHERDLIEGLLNGSQGKLEYSLLWEQWLRIMDYQAQNLRSLEPISGPRPVLHLVVPLDYPRAHQWNMTCEADCLALGVACSLAEEKAKARVLPPGMECLRGITEGDKAEALEALVPKLRARDPAALETVRACLERERKFNQQQLDRATARAIVNA